MKERKIRTFEKDLIGKTYNEENRMEKTIKICREKTLKRKYWNAEINKTQTVKKNNYVSVEVRKNRELRCGKNRPLIK